MSVLAVTILVVAVVGVSFAFFTYSKQGEKENVINTGTLVFSYNETTNGIQLTNALPLKDTDVDKELTEDTEYFDFTVTATISGDITINYDIVALETTDPDDDKTLESKYVKVMLKGGQKTATYEQDAKAATFFNALTDATDITADSETTYKAKTLYSHSISASETHYYRFYMWLADKVYDGSSNNKDTMMTNDVCKPEQTAEDGVSCNAGQIQTKGTNGKTFKVKIAVSAKDQAE